MTDDLKLRRHFPGQGGFEGLLIVAGATPLGLGIYIFYEDFWMARRQLTDDATGTASDGDVSERGTRSHFRQWRGFL